MKRLGVVFAGVAMAALMSGAALAADIAPVSLPAQPPAAPPPPPPGFSFAGPYVGAYGGLIRGEGYQAGLQGGFNFTRGPLLVGLEAQVGAFLDGGAAFEADLNARLGAVLGERFLAYGEGGVGTVGGIRYYTAGGGIELGIGHSLSVFGEAKALGIFGNGGFTDLQFQGGINWHPNY